MEEKTISKNHKIVLNNRRTGSFTGILDVLSFDLGEVLLETELGMLQIKGRDLHVNRLNLEKGEADIDGEISAMIYSEVPGSLGKSSGLLGKIFR
ncbi:MAG: sporulation protein YabP [Agathobacter sp.]|nr:sporulation protein YabP [Agathobacter sp.]